MHSALKSSMRRSSRASAQIRLILQPLDQHLPLLDVAFVQVRRQIENRLAGKRGIRNYMKLINQEYKAYPPIDMHIRSGSTEIQTSLFQLAIANASQYGNNAIIAPNALLNDQLLDIAMIRKVPKAFLPAFLLKVFSGNIHRSRYFKSFKSSGMSVQTSRPVHFHTDGDGKGISDQFEIKVEPACLRLLY